MSPPMFSAHPPLLMLYLYTTRDTFCGTWYLPDSHVHNERTVPIIMAGCMAHEREGYISTFGDSAINKRYIAYFYCACAKRP